MAGNQKQRQQGRPNYPRLHVERFVDTENDEIRTFTDRMGQALSGKGRTYSVGSMTLTLLESRSYSEALRQASPSDRSKIKTVELKLEIEERLRARNPKPEVTIEGVAYYGRTLKNGVRNFARLGFQLMADDKEWQADQATIAEIFDAHNLQQPTRNPQPHITFGDVYMNRLVQGAGENPHVLIPRRLWIPGEVALHGVSAEIV